MPNDSGVNQFGGFHQDPVQGEIKRVTQLTRAAPGVPSVTNAPKRAQRRAVQGNASSGESPVVPPPPLSPSYRAQLAAVWKELSGYTTDPEVQAFAALAEAQAQAQ